MTGRELHFMQMAIALSRKGMEGGYGGPFGCVIVKGDEVVGRGWNNVAAHKDPTAHAEVVAIRDACRFLDHFQLDGCEVYASCEPCPMCLGALYWARPSKVFYANTRHDAAAIGFDDSFIYNELDLPTELRKMPLIHLPVPSATLVFEDWKHLPGKTIY